MADISRLDTIFTKKDLKMLANFWSSLTDWLSSLRVILLLTLILLANSGLIVFENVLLSVKLHKSRPL